MGEIWRKSFLGGFVVFAIIFFLAAVIFAFPISDLNKMSCSEFDIAYGNTQESERKFAEDLQKYEECAGIGLKLFGEYNYLKFLPHVLLFSFISSLPSFFIGRIAASNRRMLIFLVPGGYFALTLFILIWFWNGIIHNSIPAFLLMIALAAQYLPLYVVFILPFICFVTSLILSGYFYLKSA